MQDPYEILGVPRDADMDEIKKAYRKLSRKYHPDANINNPNKDQAEEKFKQVQQAYQKIVDEKEHGGASSASQSGSYGYGGNGYGGYGSGYGNTGSGGSYQEQGGYEYDPFWEFFGYGYRQQRQETNSFDGNPQLRAAASYINNGYYQEAMNVLERITDRNGNWYYLRACANAGLGNNVAALDDARMAVNLEPQNQQFRQLLTQLESGRAWYGNGGGGMTECSTGSAVRYCLPCCICCGVSRCCMPIGTGVYCC